MADYWKAGSLNTKKFGNSWHGKEAGTEPIIDGDTVTDAMAKAKILDIEVNTYPMYIFLGEESEPIYDTNKIIKTKDKRLVMTNVPWHKNGFQDLGRSVKHYVPVQNRDYATVLDPLTKSYPLTGVLMVGPVGNTVIIQMEMPDFEIGGQEQERHKSSLFIAEDRQGGTKYWGTANTRMVCMNTFKAGLNEGTFKSMPNGKDTYAFLQFRSRIEQAVIESRQNYVDQLNALFTKKVVNEDIDMLLNKLFELPKVPQKVQLWRDNQDILNGDEISLQVDKSASRAEKLYENAVARQENYRSELVENFFRFNDEHSYAAWTGYGIWQATTQFFNHSNEWKSEEDTHSYNILFGDKAKQMNTAWQVLTK